MAIRRRELLQSAMTVCLAGSASAAAPKRIAAVVTEYRENSHADVIVTKFLEGCSVLDTEFKPQVRVASLYMDQTPASDIGRGIAQRHGVPISPTIEHALTLGGDRLAVDGVLLIGEHGRYPQNELGQHLYPRRRFFAEAAAVMEKSGRAVPTFNDKHLAATWEDARWMYDTARRLKIPFMAGSSLPVTWRRPHLELRRGMPLTEGLVAAYGPTESYGFHALETLQCMVERRRGGETGVRAVRWLEGADVWNAGDAGQWSWDLLEAGVAKSEVPKLQKATRAELRATRNPEAFLLEYEDGLRGTVLLLNGLSSEFFFAARGKAGAPILSTLFWLQEGKPYGHFARLSDAIQKMFLTGKPTYPVERTLLVTGVLDAVMRSRHARGQRVETPELGIRYRAA